MAVELGAGFVSVVPSARGFGGKLQSQIGGPVEAASRDAGRKAGTAMSSGFGSTVKDIGKRTAVVAGAITAVDIGGAIAGQIGQSVQAFAGFESTMNQFGYSTGLAGADLTKFTDLAKQMGADTVFSAGEAADAMLELAKGGLEPAEIQGGALKSTMGLAAAGGMELADAGAAITNAMNTFGISGAQSASVADALAGAANASSADVSDLTQGLAQAGLQANSMGMNIQDTTAVLGAFADAGMSGSDAGTSLKTMLTRLNPASKAARNQMHDLGLDFFDASGKMLPIGQVADQLKSKMAGLTPEMRAQAMQTIFGSDATRAATILFEQGASGLDKYQKATREAGNAQGMADARMKGLGGALEAMSGAVDTAKIALGEALAPAIKVIAGLIGNLAEQFSKAIDWMKQNKDVLLAVAIGAGVLAVGLGALWLVMNAGMMAKNVAGAVMALNAAIAANPIGVVIVAIAAFVAILVVLYNRNEAVRNFIQKAWRGIQTAVSAVVNWFKSSVLPALTAVWNGIVVAATFAFNWIRDHWKLVLGLILGPLGVAIALIVSHWDKVKTAIGAVFNWIKDHWKIVLAVLLGPLAIVIGLIVANWSRIKTAVAAVVNWIKGTAWPVLQRAWQGILAGVKALWAGMQPAWDAIRQAISKVVSWVSATAVPFLQRAWQMIIQGVQFLWPIIQRVFGIIFTVISKVVMFVVAVAVPLLKAAWAVLTIAVRVLWAVFQFVWNAIWAVLAKVITFVTTFVVPAFQVAWTIISTAVKVLWTVFTFVWNAIWAVVSRVVLFVTTVVVPMLSAAWNFIKSGVGLLWTAFQAYFTFIYGIIQKVVSWVVTTAIPFFASAWNTVKSALSVLWGVVQSVWNNIKSAISGAVSTISSVLGTIGGIVSNVVGFFQNLYNGIKDKVQTALDFLKSIPGKIMGFFASAGTMLLNVGKNIVQGLISGIGSMADSVKNALLDLIPGPLKSFAGALGISSPSKVFAGFGRNIVEGLSEGVLKNAGAAQDAINKLADTVKNAKKLKPGAASKASVLSFIGSQSGPIINTAAQVEALTGKLDDARKAYDDLAKARADYVAGIKDTGVQQGSLTTLSQGMTGKVSIAGLLKASNTVAAQQEKFNADSASLAKRGYSSTIQSLVEAGAGSSAAVTSALAGASDEQIRQLIASQARISTASGNLAAFAAAQYKDAGVQAAKGLATGMESQLAAVTAQGTALATALMNAVKKKLKIKSPSRVFAELGEQTGMGMVQGLASMQPAVSSALQTLIPSPATVTPIAPITPPVTRSTLNTSALMQEERNINVDIQELRVVDVDGKLIGTMQVVADQALSTVELQSVQGNY